MINIIAAKRLRKRKLDILIGLLDRADRIDETRFVYWLEDKPEEMVSMWGYEKVHPTKTQVASIELQYNSIMEHINETAQELSEIYKLLEHDNPSMRATETSVKEMSEAEVTDTSLDQ